MTKTEEKKLNEAAERIIKKMQIKDSKGWQSNNISAYWKYDGDHLSRIASLDATPELEIFTWKKISEYNRGDLKKFVKFLLGIRKEEEIQLIFWKEIKENE